jgi:SAM-dependent methyltransferase
MRLINLGCGSQFHTDWINIDLVSSSPQVRAYDIRKNIPYPDDYFDACYSSHVIEHMSKTEVNNIINECYRVLKPRGTVRIVVPDFESVTRAYLNTLDRVASGEQSEEADYDWMLIEVLDQLVRSSSGGEMGTHLSDPALSEQAKDFISERIGSEAEHYWKTEQKPKSLAQKIASKKLLWYFEKSKSTLLEFLVLTLGGNKARQSFKEGLFRNSGEIHRWMYDRYSLQRLLTNSGFTNTRICQASESEIQDFGKYGLDVFEGKTRKPDSLFMEAFKP